MCWSSQTWFETNANFAWVQMLKYMTSKYPFHYHQSNANTSQQTFFSDQIRVTSSCGRSCRGYCTVSCNDLTSPSFFRTGGSWWCAWCILSWPRSPTDSFLVRGRVAVASKPGMKSAISSWRSWHTDQRKKECRECLVNGWPSRDAVVTCVEGCTLGYGIFIIFFYIHQLKPCLSASLSPFINGWWLRMGASQTRRGFAPHRLPKQKLKAYQSLSKWVLCIIIYR